MPERDMYGRFVKPLSPPLASSKTGAPEPAPPVAADAPFWPLAFCTGVAVVMALSPLLGRSAGNSLDMFQTVLEWLGSVLLLGAVAAFLVAAGGRWRLSVAGLDYSPLGREALVK